MTGPAGLPDEAQAQALQAQTEEINRLERILSQHDQDAQAVAEVDAPAVKSEKLFSRRTLFGWAFGTLIIVFVIRMVLPVVFETVKSEVVGRLQEPSVNTAAPVVAPTPQTTVGMPVPEVPERPEAPDRPEVKERPEAPEAGSGKSGTTAAPATKSGATIIKVQIKKAP